CCFCIPGTGNITPHTSRNSASRRGGIAEIYSCGEIPPLRDGIKRRPSGRNDKFWVLGDGGKSGPVRVGFQGSSPGTGVAEGRARRVGWVCNLWQRRTDGASGRNLRNFRDIAGQYRLPA